MHTFNAGYYCKADGLKLNDDVTKRTGHCDIIDCWMNCGECRYFGKNGGDDWK